MSKPVVRVYTDYKSPYAFVAAGPTYALEERFDLVLEWRPYTLRIEEYLGAVETRTEHSWRRVRYSYMDARRYANKQGLTLKGPKRVYNGYYANAGMLFAQREGFFRAYNDAVFERFLEARTRPGRAGGDLGDRRRAWRRRGGVRGLCRRAGPC
ncbi:MAG: DsbA family protein [Thalassobaculum sp.]